MRILFAGTPEIAAVILQSLLNNPQHEVVAVLTQPDRPAGRGQKLLPSAVKILAEANRLPVLQPLKLKEPEIQATLKAYQADLMIVVAYGLIVPEAVLQIPKYGCWNVHVSLLPRWRGAAPIQRAIEAGDATTGVTLMQMDVGLDTGAILLQSECAITTEMTAGQLHDALAKQGAVLLSQGLALHQEGLLEARAQGDVGVTYAKKLSKEEAHLDWQAAAQVLDCKIRAFNPFPICSSFYQNQAIRIWQARAIPEDPKRKPQPGEIIYIKADAIGVQTGSGILELLTIQFPGAKALAVATFLNGHQDFFQVGAVLT